MQSNIDNSNDLGSLSILVIDDDPDVLFATSRILKKAGYHVFEGATGEKAIALTRALKPDLVLLDAILPDIDGTDVLVTLKADKEIKHIPVIIISSLQTSSKDQSFGLETGADGYIARPIENRELLARVRAFLRIKFMERELEKNHKQLEELVAARTEKLNREIKEKEKAQHLLTKQKQWISFNNDIASVFLTEDTEEVYLKVTVLLLQSFNCRYACIGFLNQYGDLVCPAISEKNWPTGYNDSTKNKIYQYLKWSGLWAESMKVKKISATNKKTTGFSPSVIFKNALAGPLVLEGGCIGLIGLADHSNGFTLDNQKQLEMICEFVAPILSMFIQREKSKTELKIHAKKLAEKNIALNVLLETREEGKKKLADQVLENFDRLVFPYYGRMKTCKDKKELEVIFKIIEKNTLESLSPLKKSVPDIYRQFTPMEIQVIDLIKIGKTSKEISNLLNISQRSVFFHRNNIRKKLNIQGQKANLRSFLLSEQG
ncbi:MAG TPA: DNA-binding response regulator [Bacteroidales bacterium]|nr:DNA-binding response regulator [Bacteroidales bacterium]